MAFNRLKSCFSSCVWRPSCTFCNNINFEYKSIQKIVQFINHLIVVVFSLILFMYSEEIFAVQLFWVGLRYNGIEKLKETSYNDEVGSTFKIITLFFAALANFIASSEHTTFCLNAIYSILFLFIVISEATFYLHYQSDIYVKKKWKMQKPSKTKCESFFAYLFTYLVLVIVVVADYLYYNASDPTIKYWFVFSCMIIFVTDLHFLFKSFLFLLGFFINLILNTTLYYWLVYSIFVILLACFIYARIHFLIKIKKINKNEQYEQ